MSKSQRILITGAGSGLGKALALQYAKQGNHLCLLDIDEQRVEQTAEEVQQLGARALALQSDVAQKDSWTPVHQQVMAQFGGLDVLINNAGVASGGPFDWISDDDWQWVMNINFFGVLYGCQTFVPVMKSQQQGTIINVASMAGLLNVPGMSNYNVSKAAVVSLSETLHMELAPWQLQVCCVCPSFFKTNLGQSLRSPDSSTEEMMNKLMETASEMSADDIARFIVEQAQQGEFLIIPHKKARQAWQFKCADLKGHLQAHKPLAQQIKERAKRQN